MSSSTDAILRGLGIELSNRGNTQRGSYRDTLSTLLERQTLREAQADANDIIQRRQLAEFERRQKELERQQRAAAKLQQEQDAEVTRYTRGFEAQVENTLFRNLPERDRETLRNDVTGRLQAEQIARETLQRETDNLNTASLDPDPKKATAAALRVEAAQRVADQYARDRANIPAEQAAGVAEALANPTSNLVTGVRDALGTAVSGVGAVGELFTGRNPLTNALDAAGEGIRRDTLTERAAAVRGADRQTFGERRGGGEGLFEAALNVSRDVAGAQNPGSLLELGANTAGSVLGGGALRQGARVVGNAGNVARQAASRGQAPTAGGIINQGRQQRLIDRNFTADRPNNLFNRTVNNAADIAPSLAVANAENFTANRDSLEQQLNRPLTPGEELSLRVGAGLGTGGQSALFGAAAAAVPGLRAIGIGSSGAASVPGATSFAGQVGRAGTTIGGTVAAEAGQEAIEDITSQASRNVVDPTRTIFDINPDQALEAATLGGIAGGGTGAGRTVGNLFSGQPATAANPAAGATPVGSGPGGTVATGGNTVTTGAGEVPVTGAGVVPGAGPIATPFSEADATTDVTAPIEPLAPAPTVPEPAFFEPLSAVGETGRAVELASQNPAQPASGLSTDEFLGALQTDTFDTQIAETGLFEPQADGRISIPSIFDTRTADGAGGARARTVLMQATLGRSDPYTGDDAAQGDQVLDTFGRRAVDPDTLGAMLRSFAYDRGIPAADPTFTVPTDAAREDTSNPVTTRFNRKLVNTLSRLTREDGESRARRSDGTPLFTRTENGFEINNTPFVGEETSPLVGVSYDAVSDTETATLGVEPGPAVDDGTTPTVDIVDPGPVADAPTTPPPTTVLPSDGGPDTRGAGTAPAPAASEPLTPAPAAPGLVPDTETPAAPVVAPTVPGPVSSADVAPEAVRAPIPTIAAPITPERQALANERHDTIVDDYLQTRAAQSADPDTVIRNPLADRSSGTPLSDVTRDLVANLQTTNSQPLLQSLNAMDRSTGGRVSDATVLDLGNPAHVQALQNSTPQQLQELGVVASGRGNFVIDTGIPGQTAAGSYDPTNRVVVVDPRVVAPNLDNVPADQFDAAAYAFNLSTVSEELGHHMEEDVFNLPERMFQDLRTSYTQFLNAPVEARAAHFGVSVDEFTGYPEWYQDSFNEWVGKGVGLELERNAITDAQGNTDPGLPTRIRQIFQELGNFFRARLAQIANIRRANVNPNFDANTGLSQGLSFPDVVRHFRRHPRATVKDARVENVPADASGVEAVVTPDAAGSSLAASSGVTGPLQVRRSGGTYDVVNAEGYPVGTAERNDRNRWEAKTFDGQRTLGGSDFRLLRELRERLGQPMDTRFDRTEIAPSNEEVAEIDPAVDTPAPVEVGQRKKSLPEETAERLQSLKDQFIERRAIDENVEDVVRPYTRKNFKKRMRGWLAEANHVTYVKKTSDFNDEIRDLAREQNVDLDGAIASVLVTGDQTRVVINEAAIPVEHPGLHAELETLHALLKAGLYPRRLRNVIRGLSRGSDKFSKLRTLSDGPIEGGDIQRLALADAQRRLNQGDLSPAVNPDDQFFSRDLGKFQDVARNFVRVLPNDLGEVVEFAWSPADVVRFLGAHAADGLSTDLGVTWHDDLLLDPVDPTESSSGELERRIIDSVEITGFRSDDAPQDNRRFSLHTGSSGKRDQFNGRSSYFLTVGGGDTMASRLRRGISRMLSLDATTIQQAASDLNIRASDLPGILSDKLSNVQVTELNQNVKRTARRGQFDPDSRAETLQREAVNYLRDLQVSQRRLTNDFGTQEGYATEQLANVLGTDAGITALADQALKTGSPDLTARELRNDVLVKLREVRDRFVAQGADLFDQVSMYTAHTVTNALSNERYANAAKELDNEARVKVRAVLDAVQRTGRTDFTVDHAREMIGEQMRARHMMESALDRILFHRQIKRKGQNIKYPRFVEVLTSSEADKKQRLQLMYDYLSRDRVTELSKDAQAELIQVVNDHRSADDSFDPDAAIARIGSGTPGNDLMRDLIKLEVFGTTRPQVDEQTADLAGNARAEEVLLYGDNDIGVVGLMNANLFGTNLADAQETVAVWERETRDDEGAVVDAAVTDAIDTYRKIIAQTQLNNWNTGISDVGAARRFQANRSRYANWFPVKNTEFVRDEIGAPIDLADSLSDLAADAVDDSIPDNVRVTDPNAENYIDPIAAIETDWERSYTNQQRNEGNYTILANIAMDLSLAPDARPESLKQLMDDTDTDDGKTYSLEFVRSENRAERLQELAGEEASVLTVPLPRTEATRLRDGLGNDDGITAIVIGKKARGGTRDLVNVVRGNRKRSKTVQRWRNHWFGNAVGQTTAFLGDIHTRKSHTYPLVALFRDTLTGLVQLGANEGLSSLPEYGRAVQRVANPKNIQTAYVYMTLRNAAARGGELGAAAQKKMDGLLKSDSPTGEFANLIHEYVTQSGGYVSFNTMIDNLRESSGGLLDSESKYKTIRNGRTLLDMVNRVTETGDLLTRLATYDTYRKRGSTPRAAGQKARDLSDFEQRGANELTDYGRLLHSFFNSSMVGSGVISDVALNSKYNTEVMAAGLVMGMAIVPLLAAIAGDDEEGNIYLNKGNSISHLVLPIPGEEKLAQLPINYNLGGLFFLMGNQVSRLLMGAQDFGDTSQNMFSLLAENLSPVSNEIPVTFDERFAQKWIQLMVPSVAQSFVALGMNTNNFGGPIYRSSNGFDTLGDYSKAYDSTYSQIGTGIEALTRGAAELGMPINTRVAQYMAGEWLGGYNSLVNFGAELANVLTGGAGDQVNTKNIAFGVGGFINNPQNGVQQRFYEEARRAQELNADLRKFSDAPPNGDGLSRAEALAKMRVTEEEMQKAEIIRAADSAVRNISREVSKSKSNRTSDTPGDRRARAREIDARSDPIRLQALKEINAL